MEEFSVESILSPMASGSLYDTAPKHCAHYSRNLSLILVHCFLWIEMAVNKELYFTNEVTRLISCFLWALTSTQKSLQQLQSWSMF